jgi:integrase
MASISKEANGRRTIQYVGSDGKRRSIRLGKVNQKTAETIRTKVEYLAAAVNHGTPLDEETARWVTERDSVMYDKLAAVGLVKQRQPAPLLTVSGFLTEYVSRRVDVKPATREVWRQVEKNLLEHFGEQRDLRTIDETAAEDFKLFLFQEKLASTTISKRLQFARQFFKSAVKRKLIVSNPFAEVASKATIKSDRQQFITREETQRVLENCPNVDWRVIVALSRFGGLRCPSEVLTVKWADIDWERGRFLVHSCKTEHHAGKESREVPLFPELHAILSEAFDLAPVGAVYVVSNDRYREAANTASGWRSCNLRTQFSRILRRAGLEHWPRLFHAMRASRETELAQSWPIHTVTAWLGNTPKIALKHYLMTTVADFSKAAGLLPDMVEKAVRNPVQSGAESGAATNGGGSQDSARNDISPCKTRAYAIVCDRVQPPAKYISGEDRIRTCGPVSRSSV